MNVYLYTRMKYNKLKKKKVGPGRGQYGGKSHPMRLRSGL